MSDLGTQRPHIACYVIVRKASKVAFVMRRNTSWMNGYYGLPSGKVEIGESFSAGAVREGLEETGITLTQDNLRFVHANHRHDEIDWVDVYFEAESYEGEVVNAEPHMHSELAWLDPDNLPENVIPPVRYVMEQLKAGNLYSEYNWPS